MGLWSSLCSSAVPTTLPQLLAIIHTISYIQDSYRQYEVKESLYSLQQYCIPGNLYIKHTDIVRFKPSARQWCYLTHNLMSYGLVCAFLALITDIIGEEQQNMHSITNRHSQTLYYTEVSTRVTMSLQPRSPRWGWSGTRLGLASLLIVCCTLMCSPSIDKLDLQTLGLVDDTYKG